MENILNMKIMEFTFQLESCRKYLVFSSKEFLNRGNIWTVTVIERPLKAKPRNFASLSDLFFSKLKLENMALDMTGNA